MCNLLFLEGGQTFIDYFYCSNLDIKKTSSDKVDRVNNFDLHFNTSMKSKKSKCIILQLFCLTINYRYSTAVGGPQ